MVQHLKTLKGNTISIQFPKASHTYIRLDLIGLQVFVEEFTVPMEFTHLNECQGTV